MSTNNNYLGKEVKPIFVDEAAAASQLKKFSGIKLQRLMKNNLSECTAVTLSNRSITSIEDMEGFGSNLRRLDLSENKLARLSSFGKVPNISMLNVSSNELKGDASLEELRYLPELRTLNIGNNEGIKAIRTHIVKPLTKLQALIAHGCGLERISFLRCLPSVNSVILSKNAITEVKLSEYGTFASLTKLSLGHNLLQTFPDLSVCPAITELRVNNNFITDIPDTFVQHCKKLKILDISHNRISQWSTIRMLADCKTLTNLTMKGNAQLPAVTAADVANITVHEDLAGEKLENEEEKRYRRYVLSFFQHLVGAQGKPHVQLIVLDMRRVKLKWSQGKAHEAYANVNASSGNKTSGKNEISNKTATGASATTASTNEKRKRDNNESNNTLEKSLQEGKSKKIKTVNLKEIDRKEANSGHEANERGRQRNMIGHEVVSRTQHNNKDTDDVANGDDEEEDEIDLHQLSNSISSSSGSNSTNNADKGTAANHNNAYSGVVKVVVMNDKTTNNNSSKSNKKGTKSKSGSGGSSEPNENKKETAAATGDSSVSVVEKLISMTNAVDTVGSGGASAW